MFGEVENKKIEYRNCTFYGSASCDTGTESNVFKKGFGMVLFDDSEILLSKQ